MPPRSSTTRTPLIADDRASSDRHKLEAEVARTHQQLRRLEAEYRDVLADPGTLQEDRDSTRMLLDSARRQVAATEATLAGFDDGAYGVCVGCGSIIPSERLEALPGVTTCVSCQGRP